MLTDALFSILRNSAQVRAVVQSDEPNVFLIQLPPGQQYPAIVMLELDTAAEDRSEQTVDGGPTGRKFVRYEFSCYGPSTQAKQLARAVQQTLEHFTGVDGDDPDATDIGNMRTVLEADSYQQSLLTYVCSVEVDISYADTSF